MKTPRTNFLRVAGVYVLRSCSLILGVAGGYYVLLAALDPYAFNPLEYLFYGALLLTIGVACWGTAVTLAKQGRGK